MTIVATATAACAPFAVAEVSDYLRQQPAPVPAENLLNPDGDGRCDHVEDLGTLVIGSGAIVHFGAKERTNETASVVGALPKRIEYAWRVCVDQDDSGYTLYGFDADIVETLSGLNTQGDNDTTVWTASSQVHKKN